MAQNRARRHHPCLEMPKFSFDNESIQSSVLAFSSHFRFWKGICKVASWIGLEILVPNHPWKSKIGPLQPILAAKCYVSFLMGHPVVGYCQCHMKSVFSRWDVSRAADIQEYLLLLSTGRMRHSSPLIVRTKDVERNYISKIPPVHKTCALYESNPI